MALREKGRETDRQTDRECHKQLDNIYIGQRDTKSNFFYGLCEQNQNCFTINK